MKPTPAQARALKLLEPEHTTLDAYENDGKVYRAFVYGNGHHIVLPLTAQALIDNGWVEKSRYDYKISEAGRATLASLQPEDFVSKPGNKAKLTAKEVVEILRRHYLGNTNFEAPEWIFFPELRMGSGWSGNSEQRIDAFVMNCWQSKDFLRIAFEIKVYRSDYLREMKQPEKHLAAMEISNEFYFVCPEGVITKDDPLPPDTGLMVVNEEGKVTTVKKATRRPGKTPTWGFVASLGRRIARTEQVRV